MTQQHGATRRDFWTCCPEVAGLGQGPNKQDFLRRVAVKNRKDGRFVAILALLAVCGYSEVKPFFRKAAGR